MKKKRIIFMSIFLSILFLASIPVFKIFIGASGNSQAASGNPTVNETMIQYFEWNLPNSGTLWTTLSSDASNLSSKGITAVWLPPAFKGSSSNDVGYGPYDIYDLGEFNQKGTTRTKYGTKAQYLAAINSLHNNNVKVYADIVLNHKSSADSTESVNAIKVYNSNRNTTIGSSTTITAWTKFNFYARNNKYSSFKWDSSCFDGVDYDGRTGTSAIYRFYNKTWDSGVSTENGNYDYLMSCDIDFGNKNVVNELNTWGKWYTEIANLDGYRLDAVKHISSSFYKQWLQYQRNASDKDLFSVGEYWSGSVSTLNNYISATNSETSLFDVALHYNFVSAANGSGSYDMRNLFKNSLVSSNPNLAVTFVDNHDTQPGQSLQSTVNAWFKPLAYTAILTRDSGYPCVFYGDYNGTNDKKIGTYKLILDKLLEARKTYAYGKQYDYLDNSNIIGWTRIGDNDHANSGLAALINDASTAGSKKMFVGTSHAGETWCDLTGNYSGTVSIDSSGYGTFKVAGQSNSVWVKQTGSVSTNNSVALYYKYSSAKTYVHYQVANGAWTTVPGAQMTNATQSGYVYKRISLGSNTSVKLCFNNGSGTWDNNASANYTLSPGTYYIKDGKIYKGTPSALSINVSKLSISYSSSSIYTGSAIKPTVTVKEGTKKLISGTNYTVSYSNNTSIGTATIKITGKGSYTGTVSKTFKIVPKTVTNLSMSSYTKNSITLKWTKVANATGYVVYRYNSSTKQYNAIKTITSNSTVTYTNSNLSVGATYYYKVRAYKKVSSTNYYGSYSSILTTSTRPATVTISSLSAGSKKITIKWGKITRASGYQIYMATSSNGTYTKIADITNGSTVSYTKTGLTKNKRYYFKVRAYRTVSSKKFYGYVSSVKNALAK